MTLKVWVEVKNSLGSVRSDEHEYDSLNLGEILGFALEKDAFYYLYEGIQAYFFVITLIDFVFVLQ